MLPALQVSLRQLLHVQYLVETYIIGLPRAKQLMSGTWKAEYVHLSLAGLQRCTYTKVHVPPIVRAPKYLS